MPDAGPAPPNCTESNLSDEAEELTEPRPRHGGGASAQQTRTRTRGRHVAFLYPIFSCYTVSIICNQLIQCLITHLTYSRLISAG